MKKDLNFQNGLKRSLSWLQTTASILFEKINTKSTVSETKRPILVNSWLGSQGNRDGMLIDLEKEKNPDNHMWNNRGK